MTETKYAIVIVTYNRKELLCECLECVQRQRVLASSIIIINNASTDGTGVYLETFREKNPIVDVINLPQNIGGAGGFAKGIERAVEKNVECVLLIDDDAMIADDYMEKLLWARKNAPQYHAFAGTVKVDGKIDVFHRRMISRTGLLFRNCAEQDYQQPYFECDIASFCGMVLDIVLVRQIGIPHAEYFIWHDDAEYSLRVRKHCKFLTVTEAVLDHKTIVKHNEHPRRYDWKDYYAIRNRIWLVREHGTFVDKLVNWSDLFIHVIFRNWLFGLMRRDHYDWQAEKNMVKKAICDAKNKF